jgi:hypothetical protein
MINLRNVVKAGLVLNKNYLKHGKAAWRNPDQLEGWQAAQDAIQKLTWGDCVKAVGYNPEYIFEQPIATHVLYEMQAMRIMLIFFGGGIDMPIHDHEGMIVFSKCMKGGVDVDYFDFKDPDRVTRAVKTQDYRDIKQKYILLLDFHFNKKFIWHINKLGIVGLTWYPMAVMRSSRGKWIS